MTIPNQLLAVIERLNQELDRTEREAIEGLNLAREKLYQFPNNNVVTQFFAYFNTILFFVVDSRRRIQTTIESISPANVSPEEIQEAGEELGILLGKILEIQISANTTKTRLENWQ